MSDAHQGETRQVLVGEYYSNILLVSRRNAPLTTVSDKRAQWYVERDLAEELTETERTEKFPRYSRVVRLKFKAKLEDKCDPFYHQIIETRCVVCGGKEGLTLHHVVPSVIRKWFPDEHKNHSHGWCVLLCERHHGKADEVAKEIHQKEITEMDKKISQVIKDLRDEWAQDFIKRNGGLENVKRLYKDKFLTLKPQHVPEGFLEDHNPRGPLQPNVWQKCLTKAASFLQSVFKSK